MSFRCCERFRGSFSDLPERFFRRTMKGERPTELISLRGTRPMNVQIPNELVPSIASAAERDGTTIEQIVVATLHEKFGSAAIEGKLVDKPLTLKEAWADVIGVVEGDG